MDEPEHLCGPDACICLRWPSAHETSAAWLRCLAAGRPTVITDLAMTGRVPRIDARSWLEIETRDDDGVVREPVCVSVNVLDEVRSIELALTHLASDAVLRERLARSARDWWARRHTLEKMELDYEAASSERYKAPSVAQPRFRRISRGLQ